MSRTGLRDVATTPEVAAVALVLPLIFLHRKYQPEWTLGVGSTGASVRLSDLAVLAAAAAGLVAAVRYGIDRLRPGRLAFLVGAALLAWILAATFYPLAWEHHYRFATHLVTALKFVEYALLALVVPLVVRSRKDLRILLGSLTAWSVAMSTVAVLQFFGIVNELEGRRPGQREPAYVGIHDLAALSGAVLSIGLVALALGTDDRRERVGAWVAGISGAVGLVLSGAVAGALGAGVAAVAVVVVAFRRGALDRRRFLALAGIMAVIGAGVVALRSADLQNGLKLFGVEPAKQTQSAAAETYAQRSVLAYIGWRTFAGHPLLGVGWQGTSEAENYEPYLADAKRRFPDVPPVALPSPQHAWGVQNAWLQAAAELGVPGFLLFAGLFVVSLAIAARVALRAAREIAPLGLLAACWLFVVMGVWIGLGIVAGIPQDALQWLAVGLAAAAAALAADGRQGI
ncbi:MAG: O-Antigen ligase [Gaiellaceae bacterium]|nr:O-Antigen ligase [Gaiellaceae bacterium]